MSTERITCEACNGRGQIEQWHPGGTFYTKCGKCFGSGKVMSSYVPPKPDDSPSDSSDSSGPAWMKKWGGLMLIVGIAGSFLGWSWSIPLVGSFYNLAYLGGLLLIAGLFPHFIGVLFAGAGLFMLGANALSFLGGAPVAMGNVVIGVVLLLIGGFISNLGQKKTA